jgi:MYXO-CTERM domain-containing protein
VRIAPYATPMLLLATLSVAACATKADAPVPEETDQRFDPIIGGTLDTDTTHDGVVLLFSNQSGAMCTGSIISQPGERGVVLTARHCVSETVNDYVTCKNDVAGDYDPEHIYVLRGSSPTGNKSIIGRGSKLYHPTGASLCNADIAVIVLAEAISGVQPLRVRVDPSAYSKGEQFTAIGYGLTNPSSYNSSGRRYLRDGVTVTDLGPQYWGLYENEFLGTTSICSGDSGGPAVSAQYAVMGVTSRGGDCNGNDNIWTQPDGFRDLLDEAMVYASSHYMDEDGKLQPDGTGGSGGAGGTGGAAGTGGFSGGTAGMGGEDPGSGGSAGTMDPGPSCGDLGPCPSGSTCVTDPATSASVCGMTCNDSIACPDGAMCDPALGVCVLDAGTDSPPTKPTDGNVSSSGSCSVSAPTNRSGGGTAAALMLALGALVLRRRF